MFLWLTLACSPDDGIAGPKDSGAPADSAADSAGSPDSAADSDSAVAPTDADADGFSEDDDCDDGNAAVHPGATEVCNGVDDDCDGTIDVGAVDMPTWYADADGDGHGAPDGDYAACACPADYAAVGDDCDDSEPLAHPGATEVCDGVDDDCDGTVDLGAVDTPTWYIDDDADGYGTNEVVQCDGDGLATVGGDCDDADPAANPGEVELCDGLDDDCDGTIDLGAVDTPTWFVDDDADGYGTSEVAQCDGDGLATVGGDCDDADPAANPGEVELCDGVDDDCDGTVDLGAADAGTWYADLDGDGYGVTPLVQCDGTGLVTAGGDCDDADPAANPGEVELCDGVDDDCDGTVDLGAADAGTWYADADGDGYGVTPLVQCDGTGLVTAGGDCDDADTTAYPGAPDACGDGVDGDCDGADTTCLWASGYTLADADLRIDGATYGREVGSTVAFLPDQDGDGLDELATAAQTTDGYAYLWAWPSSTRGDVLESAAPTFVTGDYEFDQFGSAIVSGDIDGDGQTDLVVSAPHAWTHNDGGVRILADGLPPGTWDAADVTTATWSGSSSDDYTGVALAVVPDVDGDGDDEVVVGTPGADGSTHGDVFVAPGGPLASGSLRSVASLVYGTGFFGYAVADAGDLDGDGIHEVAAGAPQADDAGTDAGRIYVFSGDAPPANAADADWILDGDAAGEEWGYALAGAADLDGDGRDDFVAGTWMAEVGGTRSGAVYVLGAAYSAATATLADVGLYLHGNDYSDFGIAVAIAGDVDGDGHADLLVGAENDTIDAYGGGGAYVFLGPLVTGLTDVDADAALGGEVINDDAGIALTGDGDVDGDGHADLLIGAPVMDRYASFAGAAYLVCGAVR